MSRFYNAFDEFYPLMDGLEVSMLDGVADYDGDGSLVIRYPYDRGVPGPLKIERGGTWKYMQVFDCKEPKPLYEMSDSWQRPPRVREGRMDLRVPDGHWWFYECP